jgi:hypothetical protein
MCAIQIREALIGWPGSHSWLYTPVFEEAEIVAFLDSISANSLKTFGIRRSYVFCSIPGAVINLTVADYTNAVMGAGYGSKKTRDGVISCAAYRDLRVPYPQVPPSQTDDIESATDDRAIRDFCRPGDQTLVTYRAPSGLNISKALKRYLTCRPSLCRKCRKSGQGYTI